MNCSVGLPKRCIHKLVQKQVWACEGRVQEMDEADVLLDLSQAPVPAGSTSLDR